jgi:hypothetical protein
VKLPAFLTLALLTGAAVARDETLEEKFQCLKEAVTNKNAPEVKKYFLEIYPVATAAIAAHAPESDDERETWATGVARAKSIAVYAEYALFSTASVSPAPSLVDLVRTLEEANPKSQYLDAAYGPYLVALSQTSEAAKVAATAEKGLARFPENEDLLLYLADASLTRKQPDRALTYATRLVSVMSKHPKPEGMTAAQWERKRNASLGRGYWICGVLQGERSQYVAADKNLRAALPLIQGNDSMMGPALFYLGTVNYELGKMTLSKPRVLEGARFSEQCSGIEGPYADQARHNALVMKNEAARMR